MSLPNSSALKILSISVLGIIAATIFSFSQERRVIGLILPAENIEITDTQNRTITVDVLENLGNPHRIRIRTQDGKEHIIPVNRLNDESFEKIFGMRRTPAPPAQPQVTQRTQLAHRDRDETANAVKGIKPVELHQLYLNRDPRVEASILWIEEISKGIKSPNGLYREAIQAGINMVHPWEILPLIKPTNDDESVSFRNKLNEIRFVQIKQVGEETCSTYNGYNLYQYIVRKNGINPQINVHQWAPKTNRGRTGKHASARNSQIATRQLGTNRQLNFMPIEFANAHPLYDEFIKHFLRKDIPVSVVIDIMDGNRPISHAVMLIGFETKNGVTTWEYYDPHKKFGKTNVIKYRSNSFYTKWFE